MESAIDQAAKTASTQITKLRWALGLNGALSVAVAVVIVVWPGISLDALTLLFGAYALASGVVQIVAAIGGAGMPGRGWLAFSGLVGIAVGVVVFAWPSISQLALLYVIGAYAIAFGITAVVGAFRLPFDGTDTALIVLTGLVSIAFGVVMFAEPGDGALVALALIAAFALTVGIAELVLAIGGKRLIERDLRRAFEPATHGPST